jgi:sugar O-acyltransferase (sialic acid O-acetyltransferase NeuD family)
MLRKVKRPVLPRVLILGAGGHGQVVADILLALAQTRARPTIVGFLDDNPALWGREFFGIPVLGALRDLPTYQHDAVLVAVGDNTSRMRIGRVLAAHGKCLFTAVHPTAVLGAGATIGEGTVICAGVVVNTGATIGAGVIVNTGAIIEHHCSIGHFSHVAPGAKLGGEVTIGEACLIGIGATVLPSVRVGDAATIGAGATVIENVEDGSTVVGTPARCIKDGICR